MKIKTCHIEMAITHYVTLNCSIVQLLQFIHTNNCSGFRNIFLFHKNLSFFCILGFIKSVKIFCSKLIVNFLHVSSKKISFNIKKKSTLNNLFCKKIFMKSHNVCILTYSILVLFHNSICCQNYYFPRISHTAAHFHKISAATLPK